MISSKCLDNDFRILILHFKSRNSKWDINHKNFMFWNWNWKNQSWSNVESQMILVVFRNKVSNSNNIKGSRIFLPFNYKTKHSFISPYGQILEWPFWWQKINVVFYIISYRLFLNKVSNDQTNIKEVWLIF